MMFACVSLVINGGITDVCASADDKNEFKWLIAKTVESKYTTNAIETARTISFILYDVTMLKVQSGTKTNFHLVGRVLCLGIASVCFALSLSYLSISCIARYLFAFFSFFFYLLLALVNLNQFIFHFFPLFLSTCCLSSLHLKVLTFLL